MAVSDKLLVHASNRFDSMTRTVILIAILALGLCSVFAQAQSSTADDLPVLRTGFVEFPPFKYADDEGNASGPWVEMTEAVARQAGYRLEWIHLPIARVYLYLKEGRIDLWPGVAGIPGLEKYVYESQVTPMRVVLYAFHRRKDPAPEGLRSLEGERLILINGFSYMGVLTRLTLDDDDLSRAPDHQTALRMMELNRGRYLLDYDEPIRAVRGEFPDLDLTGTPIFNARGAFVVPRTRPDAQALIDRFDTAYRTLVDNGALEPLQSLH